MESAKEVLPPLHLVSGSRKPVSKQRFHHSAKVLIGDIHGRQVMTGSSWLTTQTTRVRTQKGRQSPCTPIFLTGSPNAPWALCVDHSPGAL